MDFVPGRQLRYVWPTLSLFAKLRVAFTLRGYIRQLRAIRHPRALIPGPIAPDEVAREHQCHIMIDWRARCPPPTPSYAALSKWWNEHYEISLRIAPERHEGHSRALFDDSAPLVLCHCDMNMRNILVGDDGRLYLLDWSMSGFYPPWFEYVNWKWFHYRKHLNDVIDIDNSDWLWVLLVPFMSCGPYKWHETWYHRVVPAVY